MKNRFNFAARRSPLAARRSPLAARRSPLAARRSPLAKLGLLLLVQLLIELGFRPDLQAQCYMQGQIRPSYFNIVVLMDNTFVSNFDNAQAAKAYALPKIDDALGEMDDLFDNYLLDFNLIFFPTTALAPNYPGDRDLWIMQINNFFSNQYPCISYDCIVVLTTVFSSGGGEGKDRVALVSTLSIPTWIVAHEIGHNLGLRHPTAMCVDDCSIPTFMCKGPVIKFNDCDYQRLADQDAGVFTQTFCNPSCNCNLWADVVSPLPDNYDCSQEASVSMASDQPYLVRNCHPDRSLAMYSVTARGGVQGVSNATLRIRYLDEIYDWDQATMGVDFDESIPPVNQNNDPYHELIMKNSSGQELMITLAPNQEQTFFFKLEYNPASSVDPTNNIKPVVTARLSYLDTNIPKQKESKVFPKALKTLSGAVTTWSDFGQPVLITADVSLPQNITISTPLILVDNGAGISIQNNADVISSTAFKTSIEGCAQMWKGITINGGSSLEVTNVVIKDAQYAIKCLSGSTFLAAGSQFLNNDFAVKTESSGPEIFNITLNSNQFGTTATGLKPAFFGQTPIPIEKGFSGLFLQNMTNGITVDADLALDQPNEFFNLKYGILSYNTDLTVRNTIFRDITNVPKGSGYNDYANLIPTGKAVYVQGGAVDIKGGIISSDPPVVFDNCHTGVHTMYASANIQETIMTGVTNGILCNGGTVADLEWNNITASDRGISTAFLSGVGANLTVKNNTVTMKGNANGIGIGAGGSDLFPQNEGTVQDNSVTVEDGATGIGITTSNKIKVSQNVVTLSGGAPLFGIKIEGGDRNVLNCNTVTNTGSSSNNDDGIYAVHPSRANIICNTTDGTVRGLHFEGMLAGKESTFIAGNTMKNNGMAGLLLGTDAVIGGQTHRGNIWENAGALAGNNADLNSKFIVDANENPDFLPGSWLPLLWFENSADPSMSYLCQPASSCPIPTGPSEFGLDIKIAKGQLEGMEYQAANNWLAQRRLYERLTEEGNTYINNTDITTFLSQSLTNGLSGYAQVQIGIRQLGNLNENDRIAAAANLSTLNTGLTGNAAYQINERAVNGIFLQTVALGSYSFTESQLISLENIAGLCPLSDGEAVLRARAMLQLGRETPLHYDDMDICNGEERSDNNQKASVKSIQSVKIYPNPASDLITVEYTGLDGSGNRFTLFNTFGQSVREAPLLEVQGSLQLSLNLLPEGTYWYVLSGVSNTFGKIIINH